MNKKKIFSVLFASILLIFLFSFVSAGMFSNIIHKTQITGEVISPVCSDSDNGKDYFTKGTIVGGGVSFVQYDYCLTLTSTGQTDVSSCDSTNSDCKLHEFYCEDELRKGERISCDYGCSNGACLPEPAETSCSITSTIQEGETQEIDGKTIKIEFMDATRVKMNIAGEITSTLLKGESEELSDGKVITLNDFYLPKNANETGNVTFTLLLNSCYQEPTCTDSDGGIKYNIKGEVTWDIDGGRKIFLDYCENEAILNESYCSENTAKTVTRDCGMEGKVCSNGICVYVSVEDACIDSDNGINLYTKGKAYNPNNTSSYIKDYCQDEQYVVEAYCLDNGIIAGEPKYCDFGCKDGRCLYANETDKPLTTCKDSDQGIEFYIKGEVKTSFSNTSSIDKCSEDSKTLVEYYCSSTSTTGAPVKIKTYECPYGCIDGACIEDAQGGPSPEQSRCIIAGGTWETFSNGCADSCDYARNKGEIACTQVITQGCECGQDKCWTGTKCELNNQSTEVLTCNSGCIMNNKCYPFGYRKARQFCHENNTFISQTIDGAYCENSFECRSNLCIDDECVNQGAFKRMMNWFRNSFSRNK